MKRTIFVSGLLVCLLTLGLIFVSCDGDKKDDTVPHLTDFITLATDDAMNQRWIPKTTFLTTDNIEVAIKGTDSDLNITKFVFTLKKDDGTIVANRETPISINKSPFIQFMGYWNLPKGKYTVEVYAADAKYNISNTLSTSITVN